MDTQELPKVLVIGELNLNQKGVLSKLIALENQGKVKIEYKEGDRPSIVFDPDLLK